MIDQIKDLVWNIITHLQSKHSVTTNTYIHVDRYFTISLLIDGIKNVRFNIMKLSNGLQFTMEQHEIEIHKNSDKQLVLDVIDNQLPKIKEIETIKF
jgi:methionine synthase II (cobalamin-independent)